MIIEDSKDLERFLAGETAARWDYVDDAVLAQCKQESNIRVYLADDQQGREQLQWLRQSLQKLKQEDVQGLYGRLEAQLTNVKEEDWANNWKAYFKPFEVGNRLVVKPTWESWAEAGDRKVLEIDPGSSFGTGQHQTTRLCLELLENLAAPGQKVLDLGCGSGILFIAALLLGAEHACAVDIEAHSARVAKENAQQNNLDAASFDTYVGDIINDQALRQKLGYSQEDGTFGSGPYDIVVANIVADVILAMSPYFAGFMKKDGYLLISGIINDRQPEVQTSLEVLGFKMLERKESGDWNAMVFKRGRSLACDSRTPGTDL